LLMPASTPRKTSGRINSCGVGQQFMLTTGADSTQEDNMLVI
jgi:hypothetical protein